jgi:hypothetical protein
VSLRGADHARLAGLAGLDKSDADADLIALTGLAAMVR